MPPNKEKFLSIIFSFFLEIIIYLGNQEKDDSNKITMVV